MNRTGETNLSTLSTVPRLDVHRIEVSAGLRRLTCDAIKLAITKMDIYGQPSEIRLDERQLAEDLGVSRTPIREALSVLEQEGFVRSVPRRGVYVVRKTMREVHDMILVWAAIESMSAGLAATRATTQELAALRETQARFASGPEERVDEYSQANMAFHQEIIRLGGCQLMTDMTTNLFIHMQPVRAMTMRQDNRAARSIRDHMAILDALDARDAALAEHLVREHTLGLAAHVQSHRHLLETALTKSTETNDE